MMLSPFMQEFNELPKTLRIFPLSGAVLLRGARLPLNIFEPRYLNMVRDAVQSDQLIGMIQPCEERPPYNLFNVGCAGRITSYQELPDGRLEIELSGLCRFRVTQELSSTRGYRVIIPDWAAFESDYSDESRCNEQRSDVFKAALHGYFEQNNIKADWASMENLDAEDMASRVRVFAAVLSGEQTESTIKH